MSMPSPVTTINLRDYAGTPVDVVRYQPPGEAASVAVQIGEVLLYLNRDQASELKARLVKEGV